MSTLPVDEDTLEDPLLLPLPLPLGRYVCPNGCYLVEETGEPPLLLQDGRDGADAERVTHKESCERRLSHSVVGVSSRRPTPLLQEGGSDPPLLSQEEARKKGKASKTKRRSSLGRGCERGGGGSVGTEEIVEEHLHEERIEETVEEDCVGEEEEKEYEVECVGEEEEEGDEEEGGEEGEGEEEEEEEGI